MIKAARNYITGVGSWILDFALIVVSSSVYFGRKTQYKDPRQINVVRCRRIKC